MRNPLPPEDVGGTVTKGRVYDDYHLGPNSLRRLRTGGHTEPTLTTSFQGPWPPKLSSASRRGTRPRILRFRFNNRSNQGRHKRGSESPPGRRRTTQRRTGEPRTRRDHRKIHRFKGGKLPCGQVNLSSGKITGAKWN